VRILVTGTTGQVGGALVSCLAPLGHVIPASRAELDLSRPDELPAALDRLAPDVLINPAAYTAVDRAEDERELAFAVNAKSPGIIARWATARGVPLVQYSTDYVFSGEGDTPWREDDATRPLSVYGASKLAGEEAVRAAGGPHLIIRTSWVYAATGSNFLRTMARLARERPELRVVADQFGAPTSAAVIADATAKMLKHAGGVAAIADSFERAGGTVHLSCSGVTSWHGFAGEIVSRLKKRGEMIATEKVIAIRTEDYPVKATRPKNSRLDLSRLRDALGIVPPIWTDALAVELARMA
jgi:dTDP-4-dehydrorhamnose reductase